MAKVFWCLAELGSDGVSRYVSFPCLADGGALLAAQVRAAENGMPGIVG